LDGHPLNFFTFGNLAFIGLPISIALAVLGYRLWDVDIVIRRTLVYTIPTVTLALVFFAGMVLLQQLFSKLTGVENSLSSDALAEGRAKTAPFRAIDKKK
jgi:hypothetical protein